MTSKNTDRRAVEKKAEREARQAVALRENLKRRKEQARARGRDRPVEEPD